MKRIVLWLLIISATLFIFYRSFTPFNKTEPTLTLPVPVCDYRFFIKKCLCATNPYQPSTCSFRDACYPAIAYCLIKIFPMTFDGELLYIFALFAGLTCGLIILSRKFPLREYPLLLPALFITTAVAAGPLRGNPSAWAGGAIFIFVAWYDSKINWHRYAAALALAFAVSLKITPIVFGLLYLQGRIHDPKRWPSQDIVTSATAFAILFIIPFVFFTNIDDIGVWIYNSMENSKYYGCRSDYGFVSIFNQSRIIDILTMHKLMPALTALSVHYITMGYSIMLFLLAPFARTKYLSLLLLGTGSAFVCHHDYGLIYIIPAFLYWFFDNNIHKGLDRKINIIEATLWLTLLAPIGNTFEPTYTFACRMQNGAVILLSFTAITKTLMSLKNQLLQLIHH